ncbi:plasmid stabilization protein [Acuticoccus sediminis]|uniref:Plasmid stabilization protein n=1 Tax=Acuticoccus sediminis TaxID=2184697 RepID=A0A8B2NLK2_9HYPH|nr:type II toxin-antitoxin system RelE/ParE family toxin [Acuticoccus sediminis]RAH97244.1 plasmid stabilization protein [Acuticoccus sediminis]
MPAYRVEFAADAERDFELIFDFLEESYRSFGEDAGEAIMHAARRVEAIRIAAVALGRAPHRGTLHPQMMADLRHVTIEQAIYWFLVDEETRTVRVLAIFFGGQDHVRRMLARLLDRR